MQDDLPCGHLSVAGRLLDFDDFESRRGKQYAWIFGDVKHGHRAWMGTVKIGKSDYSRPDGAS
jgi:hypothetical protein